MANCGERVLRNQKTQARCHPTAPAQPRRVNDAARECAHANARRRDSGLDCARSLGFATGETFAVCKFLSPFLKWLKWLQRFVRWRRYWLRTWITSKQLSDGICVGDRVTIPRVPVGISANL